MLLFIGKSALSPFRSKKLLQTIQKTQPEITGLSANYLYFVDSNELSENEQTTLINIVDPTAQTFKGDNYIFVTPRFGTISPWSSKATDILQVCGLTKIKRIERGIAYQLSGEASKIILPLLHDKMTEACILDPSQLSQLFNHHQPRSSDSLSLLKNGQNELIAANKSYGFALSDKEINYLYTSYQTLARDPTIAELMMFAQINSEHCRHKIFNAKWTIAGEEQDHSLFSMIKNTYQHANEGVLSAYKDNGAIIEGHKTATFLMNPDQKNYYYAEEPAHIVIKVETHNHPTAIAPFAGAATGAGGEIRDEGATGIGAKPKAGLCGFSVSNLHIPKLPKPWERAIGYPPHIASSLDIMLQGPIGAASFNNEFGRPNICGYFRTFELSEESSPAKINIRGYHKPIMIAGGMGQVRAMATHKQLLPPSTKLIVLGGPAMLIGLGGGAASSLFAGDSHEELDFASVQRSNPEMQRRCQEVINACWGMGAHNPIISIHDVGAGGLSNALTELVHDSRRGGNFDLRSIPSADTSLNAMEIWCNESQERYVLAIKATDLNLFEQIAKRERCPFAVVGEVTESEQLVVRDNHFNESPVDVPLDLLFGEASKMHINVHPNNNTHHTPLTIGLSLDQLIERVLQLPCVADKSFLITIGDRTVTGLVARDQMVGPWQVPVADVGVTASGYRSYTGEAMAMGERTPLALLDAAASARMAVAEAITNIMAADVRQLSDIKLSANWMAGANHQNEAHKLFEAVQAIGVELCPKLGISIPVGKDSLSMQMKWRTDESEYNVVSPVSLIVSAFAPVTDIRKTLTPLLEKEGDSELMLIDLGHGKNRLGASALAQVIEQLGDVAPDLDQPETMIQFFNVIKALRASNVLLAYHDRSDGGLLATICEMSFASHVGITLDLHSLDKEYIPSLFNEELGAVIQYPTRQKQLVEKILREQGLFDCSHVIGCLNNSDQIIIADADKLLFEQPRVQLQRLWSQTSHHLQALRDNPICAQEEYDLLLDTSNPGLNASLTFEVTTPPAIHTKKPKIAVLREQGVNGHLEMAAAFDRAGFSAIDVHMTDILNGMIDLKQFQGIAACGGFSYGDVLGAGRGWANSILFNSRAKDQFNQFFHSPNTFMLGVCNGCQMMSNLKELIPGASNWPSFRTNLSEQFEARLSLVKIRSSVSMFFQDMDESVIPIAVSHGEGRVEFSDANQIQSLFDDNLVPLQYVDNNHKIADKYPANPNGSIEGIAALTNTDGRFTIMMPHPERVFRNVQFSWRPKDWQGENSPWIKMFMNAYDWVK